MKKLSSTEAELEKIVIYENSVYFQKVTNGSGLFK